MFSKVIISIVYCLLGISLVAQTSTDNLLLNSLIRQKQAIPYVGWEDCYQYVDLSGTPFVKGLQLLVKNQEGLFVFVNGTGRLYKAEEQNGKINFTRLDSTIHFGYNVGSYAFSYHDSIFSLGGYGFWRVNGQLRVFVNKTRQWDIVKLNTEVPILSGGRQGMIWFDNINGKLFITDSYERNEAVKTDSIFESHDNYIARYLNLSTREWHDLGKLSSFIIEKIPTIVNLTATPWGELIVMGNKVTLVDYMANRLLSLNPAGAAGRLQSFSSSKESLSCVFYCRDSTLYWGSSSLKILDSINLSRNDFIPTDQVVFTNATVDDEGRNIWNTKGWLYGLCALILIGLTTFFRYKLKPSKIFPEILSGHTVLNAKSELQGSLFDEKELQVLNLIVENSSKGKATDIEAINKVLGVTLKNAEVQKKQRSDVILSINKKYNFVNGSEPAIVKKKRLDFDKRVFEYFVDFKDIPDLKILVEKNS